MSILQKTLLCSFLFSAQFLLADSASPNEEPKPYKSHHEHSKFHAIVASGYAWSMGADIRDVDTDFWAPADEGYSESLGNSPFIMLGFGYRLFNMLDIDFDYTLYDTFNYQKNQTDPFGNKRTRFFELGHQSSIFNFTVFPYVFRWCKLELTPFAGMGIGVGTNRVSNFQTVFYDPVVGGVGLTTSIGLPQTTNSFAWQGMGGLRIRPHCSRLSLDLAYRYYNGGTFKTPSSVINYNGLDLGGIDTGSPWKGTLQTNQLYFAMNFSI